MLAGLRGRRSARFAAGLAVLFAASCRGGRPARPRPAALQVLDSRAFASDVVFLPGGAVGCALLERGEHRLVTFDRRSGRRLGEVRLAEGQDQLTELAVSPSGRLLAAAVAGLREVSGVESPDLRGGRAAALVKAGGVVLVDLLALRVLRRIAAPRPVLALVFLDEQRLAIGTAAGVARPTSGSSGESGGVCLLEAAGSFIGCQALHTSSVTALVRLADGLASASWDGTVRLWGPRLEPRGVLPVGAPVTALALAGRASQGPLLLLTTSREPPRRSRALLEQESRAEHRRALHAGDGVEVWRLADRRLLRRLTPHRSYVTELASSADASLIASGSWDWTVALEGPRRAIRRIDLFSQIVTGVRLSPEEDTLAIAAWSDQGSGAPSCALLPIGTSGVIANPPRTH